MVNKLIFGGFAILFFLTPLFWTPWNYELFEYNKMILTYFLTVLICGLWVWKMVEEKQFIFKITPLHIPLGLFLIANILSTVFSIDQHTSIWGYYSRSNGGLISTVSYLLLFCAYVSNFTKEQTIKLLKIALAGGFVVALWAIPEHFGVSPSCVFLRNEFNVDCWIQDVQARVFASLGQPNWLGAYTAMLIFPALYFFLESKETKNHYLYYGILISLYLALTFTFSRGATTGFLAGIGLFIFIYAFYPAFSEGKSLISFNNPGGKIASMFKMNKLLNFALISFLIVNIIYGSALTRFQLNTLISESEQLRQQQQLSSVTQLENGGTESGTIRLIVWGGAFDIFRNYPLFGSGLETFAYSYFQFRPAEHNLVSEWDFLYNKAHNEFLNYLSTTGIVGFVSYMSIIITFIYWAIRKLFVNSKTEENSFLVLALLCGYLAYLIQNLFGFSVVIIAIFFYLFPAMAFVFTDTVQPLNKIFNFPFSIFTLINQRSAYTKIAKTFIFFITLSMLYSVTKLWYADSLFAIGQKADEAGNPGKAYNYLAEALNLNQDEPLYRSELGYAAAASAVALSDTDATLSAQLKEEALAQTEYVLMQSPNNVSLWTTAVRTYYQLSAIDKTFFEKTLQALDQSIKLSPTNPKLHYNKAIILDQIGEASSDQKDPNKKNPYTQKAIEALEKAVSLKPNYREGYVALALFFFDLANAESDKNKAIEFEQKAVETMNKVLILVPGDQEALQHLNEWGKQGIATTSGQAR